MKFDAYQYEFPLHQGEFGFFNGPEVAGLTGVLGAFSWWVVLFIDTREFARIEPWDAEKEFSDLPQSTPKWRACWELSKLVGRSGRYYGELSTVEEREAWLKAIAGDHWEMPIPVKYEMTTGDVISLIGTVKRSMGWQD